MLGCSPHVLAIKKVKRTTSPPKLAKPITPVKLDTSRQTVFAKSILSMPTPVALVEGTDYRIPAGVSSMARRGSAR